MVNFYNTLEDNNVDKKGNIVSTFIQDLIDNSQFLKSDQEADNILTSENKGKFFIYHFGILANDRETDRDTKSSNGKRIDSLANFLLRKSDTNKCNLFHYKIDGNENIYYLCQVSNQLRER